MSAPTTIRIAAPSDAATLADLRKHMLVELGSDDPHRLAQLVERSTSWAEEAIAAGSASGLVAERDGRVVGGLSILLTQTQPQYRAPVGRVASIFGLYVFPEYRHQGIATELVNAAVRHCSDLGVEVITLHAAEKARPLYERAGFSVSNEMRMILFDPEADC